MADSRKNKPGLLYKPAFWFLISLGTLLLFSIPLISSGASWPFHRYYLYFNVVWLIVIVGSMVIGMFSRMLQEKRRR